MSQNCHIRNASNMWLQRNRMRRRAFALPSRRLISSAKPRAEYSMAESLPKPDSANDANHDGSERITMARAGPLERTFSPAHSRIRKGLATALDRAVGYSENPPAGGRLHTLSLDRGEATTTSWLSDLFTKDVIHKLFAAEDMGNYVIVRKSGNKQWENMPLYARIGMHILFYGPTAIRFVTWSWIRRLLKDQSIRQGKIYDSTDPKVVRSQIDNFISTYSIDTSELLERDLNKYPTFNAFFSRKLKKNARPAASPNNPTVISSAADSRLTVFRTVDAAKKFWIKGRQFTIPLLLQDPELVSSLGSQPSLAIFRLAPQDYHRIHSPVSATVRKITHIPGEYYTVNPQVVNEDLDVFTANTRSVAILDAKVSEAGDSTIPVALVAVGALLVGSIGWEKQVGDNVSRAENLGFFAYGGSTVIVVFPERSHIKFDDDLLAASERSIEVLVRAGERIAVAKST